MNFDKLTQFLDEQSTEMIPGMDLIIYQDHKQLYRHLTGFKDRENNIALNGDEQYWLFSATKVFTAVAGMQLIEKGIIRPDDPVSMYLPAFATLSVNDNGHIRAPRTELTVQHLFTMTGGFDYDIDRPSIKKCQLYSRNKADTIAMVNALAEEPLCFDPGTHFRYSLCLDVLGAVIESASGMKLGEYMEQNIFKPLGITHTGFKNEDLSRFAVQYTWDEASKRAVPMAENSCCYRLSDNFESGGAGLYSTVEDYITLADALACGGVAKNGNRILKSETVDEMRRDQLTPELRSEFMNHTGPSYSYAMGVRTCVEPEKGTSVKGEFGWDGAACAYVLIDPSNKISMYLAMHVRNFGYGYFTMHHGVKDRLYEAMRADK